jgi:hypothetical protein
MESNPQIVIKKTETPVIVVDKFNWVIPQCCREGWASCPHIPKRQKKAKKNIGM